MDRKPTLPYIAGTLLPKAADSIDRLSASGNGTSHQLERLLGGINRQNQEEDIVLKHLYEILDRLRIAAKNAQNRVDRSLALSHTFVPIIDANYSCEGGDAVRNQAHRLHLSIGRVKEMIGNPPGGFGMETDINENRPLGEGVADILAELEQKVGTLASSRPDSLHPVPNLQMASLAPLSRIPCLTTVAARHAVASEDPQQRTTALADFL